MIDKNSFIASEIFEYGKVRSFRIIDMHAHMHNYFGAYMASGEPENMLEYMDRANVGLTVFAGHRALFEGRDKISDDLETVRKFNGRFRAYYSVTGPLCDPAEDIDKIARHSEFVGFKFLSDYHKIALSDKMNRPYWEYANKNRLPVLCHTWGGSKFNGIDEARKILSEYSDVSFIAGHSFFGDWENAVKLANEHKNLYLELCAVLLHPGKLEYFVDAGIGKRMLFGTDAPWFSYDAYLGALLSSKVSDEDRIDILNRNALGVFRKAGIDTGIEEYTGG